MTVRGVYISSEYAIGIDIGGTNIKGGLVSDEGEIIARTCVPTEEEKGGAQLLAKITAMAGELAGQAPAKPVAVGIGTPGFVDLDAGLVTDCSGKIPGWTGTRVAEAVSAAVGLPACIENDVKVITLGEGWIGAARGVKNFVLLALGTGVGGGIVVDGKLLQGATGSAATLGHMIVEPEGKTCMCGSRGCLECYISTRSIGAMAIDYVMRGVKTSIPGFAENGTIDARAVFEAARGGDRVACEIVKRVAKYLGAAIVSLIDTLDPEMIVVGGGIAKAGELLLNPVRELADTLAWRQPGAPNVPIRCTELGDDAGVCGAAALVFQQ